MYTNSTNFDSGVNGTLTLSEILVRRKLLTVEQIEAVLEQQQIANKNLGDLLLELGLISAEALEKALKEQYWRRKGYWVIH